jgi:HAD superfamily hydrolase (TIGR01509 family)
MKQSDNLNLKGIDSARVRGILFDVDGTLSDTDDVMVDRMTKMLAPVSWVWPKRDARKFARWVVMASETPANFIYGVADRLGVDAHLAEFYDWWVRRRGDRKRKHNQFKIISGVQEMLETLATHYPMAVVSARDANSTQRFLQKFDLLDYFECVVTSQTCEHTKPFPDPVLYAAEQLNLEPQACLMVGDTIVDVRAGRSAGAQTIAVLCGFGSQKELSRAGAELILEQTPEVVQVLLAEHGV